MRRFHKLILLSAGCLCVAGACAALDSNRPNIGYLYPAGGQQGTTVQVRVGGQFIRAAKEVYISGDGVTAKVGKYFRPVRNLNGDQRRALQKKLREVRDQRIAEIPPRRRAALYPNGKLPKKPDRRDEKKTVGAKPEDKEENPRAKLPDHPLLDDLEEKTLQELVQVAYELFFPRNKLQTNRQLAECVMLEVTIAPDAEPGFRELRLVTAAGITNPVIFQVGQLPEKYEIEPNDRSTAAIVNNFFRPLNVNRARDLIEPEPAALPVVLNGQIMPGDTDRFRFRGKTGQQLVIETHARSLTPYLADAVPGWFQATVTLFNAAGNEMAFADDFRFNPDPVLFYAIPRDGIYELEIRDSIYRGRQDFVYRIMVGEQPFITQMHPLGSKQGVETTAAIDGWNLPQKQLTLDSRPAAGGVIYRTSCNDTKTASNTVPYAVDMLPECNETETNDTLKEAQKVQLPNIVNGQILKPGDVDVFSFSGRTGEKIVAEVYARRLNSPLDSLLRLTDASGKVLAWNDDHVQKDEHLHKDIVGLLTHHADSYLIAELPKNGMYFVHLADSQHHGSTAHSYRLRMAPADGDFALRVTPSGLSVPAGQSVPISVHVMRKDGFEGPIELFVKDPGTGFKISAGLIPAGKDSAGMTLTAPPKQNSKPLALELEGRAEIGGNIISRDAVGADDTMQAFLFRHLVPAQELVVMVTKPRRGIAPVKRIGSGPVQIPAGGSAQVKLKTTKRPFLKDIKMELYRPPTGISLGDVTVTPEGLAFVLKADDTAQNGLSDNLIIEIFREFTPKPRKGKPAPKKRRNTIGVLPAIPIQVVDAAPQGKYDKKI